MFVADRLDEEAVAVAVAVAVVIEQAELRNLVRARLLLEAVRVLLSCGKHACAIYASMVLSQI